MIECLDETERDEALAALRLWSFDAERVAIHRRLQFADFASAVAAIVRIGIVAEKADHHPEWTNVYNRIDIWLTTHDAGGVSERDVSLAKAIDSFYPSDQRA